MTEYYPKLIWWAVTPIQKEGGAPAKQRRLTPVLFKSWDEVKGRIPNDQCLEVLFFGEDDMGSGLIKTRAEIMPLGGLWFVKFGSQFYELNIAKMITESMLELTEGVPYPVLYTFKLSEDNNEEDDLIVVTGDSFIHDAEVFPEEIEALSDSQKKSVEYTRDFYRLTLAVRRK